MKQEKYKLLTEIPDLIRFFFEAPVFEQEAIEKVFGKPEAKQALELMIDAYGKLENFVEAELEAAARQTAKANGLKAGQIFHPIRVAVSGRTHGPTLFKMLEYMGRETVVDRLQKALAYCK